MIKAKAAAAAATATARPKPRPKKPSAKQDDAHDGDADSVAGGAKGASDAKQQKAKRRRTAPKKKETDSDGADGHHKDRDDRTRGLPLGLQFLQRIQEDQRYERAPRLLPDITGVKSLSSTEINSDIKNIQSALTVFEAKVTALVPPGAPNVLSGSGKDASARAFEDEDDDASYGAGFGFKPRRSRPNGVITPEEIVESLPACRRAVRVTQRELAVMKRERDDLERDFMRMRCKYVYQVSEMKKMQKQQDRITRVLGRDVVKIAKGLESSRRRTNALQDIMTELETRGNSVVRLTREKRQMELLLKKHDVTLPEIDEVYIGDRVKCSLGFGNVHSMDGDTRILALDMEEGGRAFVQEDEVEVLPVEATYLDVERDLKQSFFEKIGALVQPNGRFGGGGRQRGLLALDAAANGGDLDDDDDDDSEDDDDDDEDDDDSEDDDGKKNASSSSENPTQKKRKLNLMTAAATSGGASSSLKKKKKNVRLIEYPACTIPITPYDTGLLLSPLSTLSDRVAAVGPSALQWKDSYLPSRMQEWEQERYESLQMKGEIERLRFQLQRAEAEKLDAQQHASDQLESINQLVTQLDKLRESMSAGHEKSSGSSSHNSHAASSQCPSCGTSNVNGSRKNSATSVKLTKSSSSKPSSKKDAGSQKRQHGESMDDDGSEESEKSDKKTRKESSLDDDSGEPSEQHDASKDVDDDDADAGADSSDGASSKPATRSLRPRRKPTSNSTTASPKQSK